MTTTHTLPDIPKELDAEATANKIKSDIAIENSQKAKKLYDLLLSQISITKEFPLSVYFSLDKYGPLVNGSTVAYNLVKEKFIKAKYEIEFETCYDYGDWDESRDRWGEDKPAPKIFYNVVIRNKFL
ncbi:MAG: hypothetical protein Edafosvirus4_17 [Edafosvirus sp.]|uniref:Uncharacterized protein n=1 Tax=Edafosvirus sp. TaxID=2487765 RepID=A0A3G4ZWQ6_9VIRU|nr:MAG: hypothetical protein Edafosvirus4_17 [Edafosvirus sp.]